MEQLWDLKEHPHYRLLQCLSSSQHENIICWCFRWFVQNILINAWSLNWNQYITHSCPIFWRLYSFTALLSLIDFSLLIWVLIAIVRTNCQSKAGAEDILCLMRGNALFLGGGAHSQGGSILVWYVSEIASWPVIERRAQGKAGLFPQRFSVRPVHQVEVTHFVFVSWAETLGEDTPEIFWGRWRKESQHQRPENNTTVYL